MSNIFNDLLWPNGMQTDSEGYAIFYPLGTNKIPIPTTASDWPEGSKLIFPFVYDENDKLVDFCDTKAMEIDNNNTVIDMPYTDIKADFSSIIEGTLTINTPSDSNVEIKWGSVDKVLTEKIEKVLGKGNCKVSFDKDTNKATIAVALDTTESQLADVQTLLDRVLPRNLVTEMEWIDGMPIDYTPVEYLEGNSYAYIDSEVLPTDETEIRAVFYYIPNSYSETHTVANNHYTFGLKLASAAFIRWGSEKNTRIGNIYLPKFKGELVIRRGYVSHGNKQVTFDCDSFAENPSKSSIFINAKSALQSDGSAINRWYDCRIYENGTEKRAYIPALDPTGAPCMFDLVTRKPFYNNGTGDFLYPGAEQAIQTLDLDWDAKSYAKLTEHGVRRLYHVPKGYAGTMDEYAAANGFKELVEPPMPMTGYWQPQWRETETQLICDWVETEAPEELETNNEIEG